jgi:signal peptidase I
MTQNPEETKIMENTETVPAQTGDNTPEKIVTVPMTAKEELGEFFRTALVAVVLALLIRTFLFEPFNIPSGSMKPTLLVGDYLFVSKPAYGYSRYSFPFGLAPIQDRVWDKMPERGDVIVFKLPTNKSVDYIKRLIGLPGDTIQVRGGRLFINGKVVQRDALGIKSVQNDDGRDVMTTEYTETLPGGAVHSIYEENDSGPLDDTPLFTVPEGHFFMMGDNRDNSQDSRVQQVVGFVPFENLVGRADFIFFSTDGTASLFQFWKWPFAMRYHRFFNDIDPVRLPKKTAQVEKQSQ